MRPFPVRPRRHQVEHGREHRGQHRELEQHHRRHLGRVAQRVRGDGDAEVARVDVAAGHRADRGLARRAAPEQPDGQVQQAHDGTAHRGDDERRGEDGADVGLRERHEQQRGAGDEERQAGEDLHRRGPQHPRPRQEVPQHDHDADDDEPVENAVHEPTTCLGYLSKLARPACA